MKRFTGHSSDEWGEFIDIKQCEKAINSASFAATSTVLVGSVTDPYNPFEKQFCITRKIVEELIPCSARVEILTKSDLVVRDMDLFKQFQDLCIGISLNTLDDQFRKETEPRAASVERRIGALKELHENGVKTYLFISPIFPELSDCIKVVDAVSPYVDYVCFENLNLRGAYLPRVMEFITSRYPELTDLYKQIYWNKNMLYWEKLKQEISAYCAENNINSRIYFYHEQLKKR